MKISCVEPLGISAEQFGQLKSDFASQGHEFCFFLDRKEDEASLVSRMCDADIVIISNIKLSSNVLAACPKLKMLSVAFTGLDHIDMEYCRDHNITVNNAAGYSTIAVSELAIGLALDVYRHITSLDQATREGGTRNNFLGRELHGKTFGVVGTGAIGTATLRLAKAFGCKLLAYSRSQRPEVIEMGVKYCSLEELVSQCDIISLHVPLNSETHHLIDKHQLSLMKPTAILVNTARGNVVDIDALAEALSNGKIAGAGIDVFEKEPPLATTHPLLNANNCIVVPHIGYATREAFDIRAGIVIDNVKRFLAS